MAITFFFRGLLIGLSIAAVVGPMSILCMHRTLTKGRLYGLISGLGIATADSVYGSIAAFGITIITAFLVSEQAWIRGLGGLFLIYLGLKTLLSKLAKREAGATGASTPLRGRVFGSGDTISRRGGPLWPLAGEWKGTLSTRHSGQPQGPIPLKYEGCQQRTSV